MSKLFDVIKKAKGKSTAKVEATTKQNRLNTCSNCPLFGKHMRGVCGLLGVEGCGCIISDKSNYRNEYCPEGKWENGKPPKW